MQPYGDMPFAITSLGTACGCIVTDAEQHTVTVTCETVHKLDAKYLPGYDLVIKADGVASENDWEWSFRLLSGDFATAKANMENNLPVTAIVLETQSGDTEPMKVNRSTPVRLFGGDGDEYFVFDLSDGTAVDIFQDGTIELD